MSSRCCLAVGLTTGSQTTTTTTAVAAVRRNGGVNCGRLVSSSTVTTPDAPLLSRGSPGCYPVRLKAALLLFPLFSFRVVVERFTIGNCWESLSRTALALEPRSIDSGPIVNGHRFIDEFQFIHCPRLRGRVNYASAILDLANRWRIRMIRTIVRTFFAPMDGRRRLRLNFKSSILFAHSRAAGQAIGRGRGSTRHSLE